MSEILKSRHAFGSEANIDAALASGAIDEYDILFLREGKIGWIDGKGNKVILPGSQVKVVDELPAVGEAEVIYIKESVMHVWNGGAFKSLNDVDLTELEVAIAEKADAKEVNAKIEKVESALDNFVSKKYVVSHKPEGTLVSYRDKEIRVMCPVSTEWILQQSGEGADKNKHYIGFKAYAPDNAVSFKEDLAEIIADGTMYYFENNEFAGFDNDGRKYSIVWLPVAVYDDNSGTWSYYGANSTEKKYVGWYYSVEWYNAEGVMIASDCIRINLSNEDCHSSIKPFYMNSAMGEVDSKIEDTKTYTDEQIAAIMDSFAIVEF